MKKQTYFFLSTALVVSFLFWACNTPKVAVSENPPVVNTDLAVPATTGINFDLPYEKFELENGLDVILHKDASDPIVAVAILFHVGSNREKPGRTGFAHFFEHMLFQASENVGKGKFFKIIEEMGGDFNGGTWQDGTIYFETIPKDGLEKVLWMESDRMGFMINTVTLPVLENEKQVVKNEKRQRVDNVAYGHNNYVVNKALYPEDHPYNWQVIGSLADLQAATLADVKDFYNKWYGPNNATMVIAGDLDIAQTKELVKKYFGEIPGRPAVEKIAPRPGVVKATTKLMYEDNFAQVPQLRMVWPTVQDAHPDSYALNYLGQILSDGKRAALYKEIVENQKLAPAVSAYNSVMEIAGTFNITVRANAATDLDKVLSGVEIAMKNFETAGIDDKDMERIKASLEKDFYQGNSGIMGKAQNLAQYNEFNGSPEYFKKEITSILSVTKADVMRVYEKYVKGKPYILTAFVPKGQLELAVEGAVLAKVEEEPIVAGADPEPMEEKEGDYPKTPSKLDRTTIPALGAAPVVKTPAIYTKALQNGLTVYGIENRELPMVSFSLRIKGGAMLDTPEKQGVANLITDIMMEGTMGKTPEELQDAIGQLGSDISMSTSGEYISVNGSCLARNLKATIALVEEILLEPRWDAAEFDRIKQSTITGIKQRAGSPTAIGNAVFTQLIYGKSNPLSRQVSGEEETVQRITLDDVKAYYATYFSPAISHFHITGATSQADVTAALASLEYRWAKKAVTLPDVSKLTPTQPGLYFIEYPGAKQSVIYIGQPSVEGKDPNYYPLTVVNDHLGGGSSGILFQTLREEKGYTYGAYSGLSRRISPGFFFVNTSVRANVTKESVALLKDILGGYQNNYSQEDLDRTRNSFTKSNALAFETLGDKMGMLLNISTYNLPVSYMDQQQKVLAGMTLDQSKYLIQNYMDPAKMIYLVVGDGSQLEGLKGLGLGTPIVLDKKGERVSQ